MKILNLYACLGGNRYKWGEEHEITAVEWDEELARLYQERFRNDTVIVADAHQYLIDHYQEFDFIWSSPPCPTHSRANFWASKSVDSRVKSYPNMSLYQEVIFLQHWFEGKFVVENVIPYYEPLIPAIKRDRHLYWTNFKLPSVLSTRDISGIVSSAKNELALLSKVHDYDFTKYKGEQPTLKIARNLVDYEAGKTILDTVLGVIKSNHINQVQLFA